MADGQEVVVDPAQQTAETDEAAVQAAFLAEMATPDDGSDVKAPAAEPESKPAEAEVKVDPAVVERKEVLLGMTEEELRDKLGQIDRLQKAVDTTAGTFGSRLADQQRAVEELRNLRQQSGGFSKEKLTRLSKEYPDLAALLAEDLSEAITQGGGQAFDPSKVEEIVSSRISAVEERFAKKEVELEIRYLSRQHPDWKVVAAFDPTSRTWNNPEFGEWTKTLPEDVQEALFASTDAEFLSKQLTAFKESIKKPEPPPVKKDKKEVLEAAVMPTGSRTRQEASETDEEAAAFRAEMARQ